MEWIKVKNGCKMPKEDQDILYVVTGTDHSKPSVVRGTRSYEINVGWWWCDENGIIDAIGNDGKHSYVIHWMPTPTPPRIRKRKPEPPTK